MVIGEVESTEPLALVIKGRDRGRLSDFVEKTGSEGGATVD